jgi:hypothetical protein
MGIQQIATDTDWRTTNYPLQSMHGWISGVIRFGYAASERVQEQANPLLNDGVGGPTLKRELDEFAVLVVQLQHGFIGQPGQTHGKHPQRLLVRHHQHGRLGLCRQPVEET